MKAFMHPYFETPGAAPDYKTLVFPNLGWHMFCKKFLQAKPEFFNNHVKNSGLACLLPSCIQLKFEL